MIAAKLVRLPSPEAVAVAIECCYQNTGLALTIALSAVPKEDVGKASAVPLVYAPPPHAANARFGPSERR